MADEIHQPIQTDSDNVAVMSIAWEMTKLAAFYVPGGITGPEVIQELYAKNLNAVWSAWRTKKVTRDTPEEESA